MLANTENKRGNKGVIKSCESFDSVGDKNSTFNK